MDQLSSLNKGLKYDHRGTSQRVSQSSLFSADHYMPPQNGGDPIKTVKLESMQTQHLKRRRSHSHNTMEYANTDLFNDDRHHMSRNLHADDTSGDSTQFSRNTGHTNSQWIKERHKKETHNRVERKRRDFINEQIQKLADLLPSDYVTNDDIKMNKGVILKNSVEYISNMKYMEEINGQLIEERELASRLIRNLASFNDLNHPDLFIKEDLNHTICEEELDISALISKWHSVHRKTQDLFQSSPILSTTLSENNVDMNYENMSALDSINNNELASGYSRKRYSSVPSNINNDYNGPRSKAMIHVLNSNSILKSSEAYNIAINEPNQSNQSLFSQDNYYVQYLYTNSTDEDVSTDIATTPSLSTSEKFYQSKDKMINGDLVFARSQNGHVDKRHDPMLLSGNTSSDDADR